MHTRGAATPIGTLIDRSPLARDLIVTTCFGALTALGAQISFRLPFTPVPVTGQMFFVILSGLMLGSRLGAISQLQYLLLGLAGLPVFANFTAGPVALMGPSGGYLFGFVAGAYVIGLIRERGLGGRFSGTLSIAAGITAIYLLGVLQLSLVVCGGDLQRAFALGAVPFLGVDIAKAILALGVSGALARLPGDRA